MHYQNISWKWLFFFFFWIGEGGNKHVSLSVSWKGTCFSLDMVSGRRTRLTCQERIPEVNLSYSEFVWECLAAPPSGHFTALNLNLWLRMAIRVFSEESRQGTCFSHDMESGQERIPQVRYTEIVWECLGAYPLTIKMHTYKKNRKYSVWCYHELLTFPIFWLPNIRLNQWHTSYI